VLEKRIFPSIFRSYLVARVYPGKSPQAVDIAYAIESTHVPYTIGTETAFLLYYSTDIVFSVTKRENILFPSIPLLVNGKKEKDTYRHIKIEVLKIRLVSKSIFTLTPNDTIYGTRGRQDPSYGQNLQRP
jgi:hypothetical protein